MTTELRLEAITPANFETATAIEVRPDQHHLVAPVVKSLAEAYVHPAVAWPRLIMDGGRAVGFLMAFFDIDFAGDGTGNDVRSGLWRLNIAAHEQGRGYGRFAVESVADEIRRRGGNPSHGHVAPRCAWPGRVLPGARVPADRRDERGSDGRGAGPGSAARGRTVPDGVTQGAARVSSAYGRRWAP